MEWYSRNRVWIIAIAIFALSATFRFLAEIRTVHPTGWDGYYYVMQVHSWITFGHMQAPDFSLIYPFLTLFTFVAGDPIIEFKIGVAVLSGLLAVSVYVYLLNRNVALSVACLACSYIIFSPLVTYFILQFPKNTLGLILFIFFVDQLSSGRLKLAAVLFIATVLTHRMTGAFALIVIALYSLRFISWKWIVAGGVVVLGLGFLPGILHISDLSRLQGQFTPTPHWAPWYFGMAFKNSLDWFFTGDLIFISLMAITAAVLVILNFKKLSLPGWIWFAILVISLFPFFQFSAGAIGYRFFMITPIALTLLLVEFLHSFSAFKFASATLIILSIFSFRSYKPSFDAPNEAYVPIVERLAQRYDPKTYPLVIVHKSLAEFIIFKTDFDALNWLPPDNILPENILRIVHRVPRSDFSKYLDVEDLVQVKTIGMTYLIVPENVWQKFVTAASKAKDTIVMKRINSGNNPMEKRPYFINKGRR